MRQDGNNDKMIMWDGRDLVLVVGMDVFDAFRNSKRVASVVCIASTKQVSCSEIFIILSEFYSFIK
jgi:hypothetical protein